MKKIVGCFMVLGWLSTGSVLALDGPALRDREFQEQLHHLRAERDAGPRLQLARQLASENHFTSQQVKAIALTLGDDAARVDFAAAAYSVTVDPENFYDVYDAFTKFSQVMRLHDRIEAFRQPTTPSAVVVPRGIPDPEFQEMLQAIRHAAFDADRRQVAEQILASNHRKFLASQVKEILGCFSFDADRLEVAKLAYDYTLDREKFYVVNSAFSFSGSVDKLSQYVQSRQQPPPGGPHAH
ncbi:MAG TPA: DUF4476 domain-containing protein [Dongiaceae bacterium]|nr:DUF4476 domain-containing protein [Dongiaceae bacterium]